MEKIQAGGVKRQENDAAKKGTFEGKSGKSCLVMENKNRQKRITVIDRGEHHNQCRRKKKVGKTTRVFVK